MTGKRLTGPDDPVQAGVDAGLMEAADALLTRLVPLMTQARRRDAIYAALLTERRRAEAAMRERAGERLRVLALSLDGEPGAEDWINLAADTVLALSLTEDTP